MCSQNCFLIRERFRPGTRFLQGFKHKKVSPLAQHLLCFTLQKTVFRSLPFHIWTQFLKQIAIVKCSFEYPFSISTCICIYLPEFFCRQYAVYHRIFSFLINKHHLRKLFDINVKTKKMHLFVLQFGNEAKIVPQIEMW